VKTKSTKHECQHVEEGACPLCAQPKAARYVPKCASRRFARRRASEVKEGEKVYQGTRLHLKTPTLLRHAMIANGVWNSRQVSLHQP
jgi:hypothetical protein